MREIKIISNSQNRNETFMSDASTLGELKAELINKGYEVNDMDFKEGKSRITLNDDMSVLPSEFMYKGELTSDLVIMMTPKNTKIKSGMTRGQLYDYIKTNDLQETAYNVYGKNFTNCTNAELEEIVSEYREIERNKEREECECCLQETIREIVNEELDKREPKEYDVNSVARCLLGFLNAMHRVTIFGNSILPTSIYNKLKVAILKNYEPYTEEEIEEMFN